MEFIKRKTPYEKELEELKKKERKFFSDRLEKKQGFIEKALEDKVPPKLQETLDAAFAKAFRLIFEKGNGIIEKTYQKEKAREKYLINEFIDDTARTRKSLKAFSKRAKGTGRKNIIISGVSGAGMGLAGLGLPDIPVFTATIMKAIYEIATSYGFTYESEEERIFILLLIKGALSYGDDISETDALINQFIDSGEFPEGVSRQEQINAAAGELSKEILYVKFLQGIPLVGTVGGIYNAMYMKRITDYATLKYRRRFLLSKGQSSPKSI